METQKKVKAIFLTAIITLQLFSLTVIQQANGNPFNQRNSPLTTFGTTIDGKVSKNEYSNYYSDPNGYFQLYWKISGEYIYFAMIGNTTGWVGIGFEPGFIVKDADMIIGWVNNSGGYAFDAYATQVVGGFKLDTELGGTNDLITWNGTETSTQTTIEFVRPLVSNDKYDKTIDPDKNTTVIWAIGDNNQDNMETRPIKFGNTLIEFGKVNVTQIGNENTENYWIWIVSVLIVSLITGILIIYIIKTRKKKG